MNKTMRELDRLPGWLVVAWAAVCLAGVVTTGALGAWLVVLVIDALGWR